MYAKIFWTDYSLFAVYLFPCGPLLVWSAEMNNIFNIFQISVTLINNRFQFSHDMY